MHPHTPATPGMPTEPEPLAQVNVDMQVVDSAGDEVGTVESVYMSGTGPVPEVSGGEALREAGYVVVRTGGLRSRTVYVTREQVADVAEMGGGLVTLNVTQDRLTDKG